MRDGDAAGKSGGGLGFSVQCGPREVGEAGHVPFAQSVEGDTRRIRAESFADHYSQARQFWISQTPVEQDHIVAAYVFELGKCEIPEIRSRVMANLRNVDEELAQRIADGLGMELPEASPAAVPTRTDLEPTPATSILANAKQTFEGRKLGILVGRGADGQLVEGLRKAVVEAGGTTEIVAVAIGGETLKSGSVLEADHALAGGPSVLFDAVAIIAGDEGGQQLADEPAARDFLTDAFTHMKVIGLSDEVAPLVTAAGLDGSLDDACIPLRTATTPADLVTRCAAGRAWDRNLTA